MARKGGKRYRYRTNTQDIDWQEERADASQNIGEMQRLFSAIAGMGLIMHGLRVGFGRRRPGGRWRQSAVSSGYRILPGVRRYGDRYAGYQPLGRRKVHSGQATKVRRSIDINRPAPLSSIVSGARSIIFHEL